MFKWFRRNKKKQEPTKTPELKLVEYRKVSQEDAIKEAAWDDIPLHIRHLDQAIKSGGCDFEYLTILVVRDKQGNPIYATMRQSAIISQQATLKVLHDLQSQMIIDMNKEVEKENHLKLVDEEEKE